MTTEGPPVSSAPGKSDLRFLIIGAGMSGILSAIKLQEAGLDNFAIYEKADRLGGTWRENTYPGIACDVPSHFYSYSFAPNPEWSHRFAPGSEIHAYFEEVARRYGVASRIQYGNEVTHCAFEDGRWKIELADGTTDQGDFVIAATGVLHHPAYPEIEGLDSFGGAVFHTARWDHEAPLAGKRIGIVGTGSSAIQIVSAIVDDVAELTLFQRTAQWITPIDNGEYLEEEKAEFRRRPEAMAEIREEVARAFTDGFANVLVDAKSPMIQAIHAHCLANLENSVKDPELREKLRPSYQAACKRLIMSENFYDAIQRPNAMLVTEEIERIEKSGVRTRDGVLHELDILVLATGFRVESFVRPMQVTGRGGKRLDDVWKDGPFAYLAISVPDFPNFFMLNGPNGPVGNFSLIEVAELQLAYILQLVDLVRAGEWKEVCASQEAADRFDAERREAAKSTIWATGCKSWYLDEDGLPTAWPFTFDRFREEMSEPRIADLDRI
ncbi:MAG: NAD(P)/FAD-dependent oxidoreductase [Deltaproteobacteria bacterium]|nr:NAD(P)/FAD-dependent oxidoreductase [Deltaproteobacteria bacterium]MBW2395011.1 NAD(P)/FAD-dependent oxidoreductase [Deltaproteobacteria bacterium]